MSKYIDASLCTLYESLFIFLNFYFKLSLCLTKDSWCFIQKLLYVPLDPRFTDSTLDETMDFSSDIIFVVFTKTIHKNFICRNTIELLFFILCVMSDLFHYNQQQSKILS